MNPAEKAAILVVDDEASNLAILNQILKGQYRVLVAKTGQAALRMASEKKPRMVLLDRVLPDISGFEVLEVLKRDESTRGIPVIIISTLSGEGDKRESLALGAADYITKPFGGGEVREKVRAHLR